MKLFIIIVLEFKVFQEVLPVLKEHFQTLKDQLLGWWDESGIFLDYHDCDLKQKGSFHVLKT